MAYQSMSPMGGGLTTRATSAAPGYAANKSQYSAGGGFGAQKGQYSAGGGFTANKGQFSADQDFFKTMAKRKVQGLR